MNENYPLVTIGTLSYNTGKYVVEALECVKRQQYPNIQHIIIDDCSQDDSLQLITEWIEKNNYKCTLICRKKNQGVHAGLTDILKTSQGKYLAMISDDLLADDMLMKQVKIFESLDDTFALVYGDTQMIDKECNILVPSMFEYYRGKNFTPPSGNIFQEIVKDFYFFIQASLIRLDSFRKINYVFNKEIISEDWDWQLSLSRNFNIYGTKQVCASYRWLETSIGRTNWTDEKIHSVWVSQTKMLLNYYDHPKNSKEDKAAIYDRVKKLYFDLNASPKILKKQKLKILKDIFKITGKAELPIRIAKNKIASLWR